MNLFPRNPGPSRKLEAKEIARAHRVLDRRRDGRRVRISVIDWALNMTGDLPIRTDTPNEAT